MKNRVYKIKDKILVRGNENELTKDEVLVKEENGSVVLKERVNGEVKDIVVKGGSANYTPMPNLTETQVAENAVTFNFTAELNEEQKTILQTEEYIEFIAPLFLFDGNENGTFKIKRVFQFDSEVSAFLFSGYIEFAFSTMPCMVSYIPTVNQFFIYTILL